MLGSLLKGLVYAAILVVFFGSLLAIGITGPVVVRAPRLELDIAPSPERLRRDVEHLVAFAPRDVTRPERLLDASEWIAGEMREAGLEVSFQDYPTRLGTFRNVVGFRRGLEPGQPVRILGAHYDAYDASPGADDNGSGVAVLLELARTLPPERPRRDQYFVAFSTEEPPLFGTDDMGSSAFARDLVARGIEVDLMIALDLVGYYSDEPGSQGYPVTGLGLLYPDRGDFLAVVGDLRAGRWIRRVKAGLRSMTDLPVFSFRGPMSMPGVGWSDHASFRALDLPGVLLTDTAYLRNPWYHTDGDTPDRLDYDRLAEVVRGLAGLFWDREVSG